MLIERYNSNKSLNVLFIAGVHGNELTAMNICKNLHIKCKQKSYDKANITFLNYVNMYGLKRCVRECYSEENSEDLNRHHFERNHKHPRDIIYEEINKHDIIIDIHSSPWISNFFLINNNSNTDINYFINKNIGYVVRDSDAKTIKNYCLSLGKLGFTYESSGLRIVDNESSNRGVWDLYSILNDIEEFYDIQSKAIKLSLDRKDLLRSCVSTCSGFLSDFSRKSLLGKPVMSNEKIITVKDYIRGYSIDMTSPADGTIVEFIDRDYVNEGDVLFSVQPDLKK